METLLDELGDEIVYEKIPWHPAFIEALQMELEDYRDALEFHPEYQLTSEPLRIDCVVIKKVKDIEIKKNIAAIFREWNLLEYKSPGDYVSVETFYKVYGYACLYAFINKVSMTSLTVSFVESRYPQKLIQHLRRERGYTVAETGAGIYTVTGDILPIQIIDSRRLSTEENLWLKGLSDRHDGQSFSRIDEEISKKAKTARLRAYLYTITSANPEATKEAIKMGKKNKFNQLMEEIGLAAEWEARGRAEGERKVFGIAQNLVKLGLPIETVISATQLDPEKVRALYQTNN